MTRVLYPDDSSYQGRELRLRQEYFFVSASVQDILHRFLFDHEGYTPEFVARVVARLKIQVADKS